MGVDAVDARLAHLVVALRVDEESHVWVEVTRRLAHGTDVWYSRLLVSTLGGVEGQSCLEAGVQCLTAVLNCLLRALRSLGPALAARCSGHREGGVEVLCSLGLGAGAQIARNVAVWEGVRVVDVGCRVRVGGAARFSLQWRTVVRAFKAVGGLRRLLAKTF